jgi:uncharacterized protein
MKVAWLHVAPVKGLLIDQRDHILLGERGVEDDRRFCLIDDTGHLLNGKRFAPVGTVAARFDPATARLELRFADDGAVADKVRLGDALEVHIFGSVGPAHLVEGPWNAALTERFGRPVRLVRFDDPGSGHDRAREAAGATLLSRASLERMAEEAGIDTPVDPRRFRMLIGIDGARAHQEDEWIGRRVRVGEAVVVPAGNVGRCVTTTRRPGSAESDLDTLHLLAQYRRDVPTSEALPFGIWARVERPGRIALGDEIVVED